MLVAEIDGKKVVFNKCAISCEDKQIEEKVKSRLDLLMRFEPHSPTMEHTANQMAKILEKEFDARITGWHEAKSVQVSKRIDPYAKVAY